MSAITSAHFRILWFAFGGMLQCLHSFCTLACMARLPELDLHAFIAVLRRCSAFIVFCSCSGRELSKASTDSKESNVVKSAAGCSTLLTEAGDLLAVNAGGPDVKSMTPAERSRRNSEASSSTLVFHVCHHICPLSIALFRFWWDAPILAQLRYFDLHGSTA